MKPTRFSYSAWSLYKGCPAAYEAAYIHGTKRSPPSPAMARGTRIHALAENYVLGKINGMPDELASFSAHLNELKRVGAHVEEWWAVDKDWQPVTKDSPQVFLLSRTDAYVHEPGVALDVIDYKTGKVYDDHGEQGELYGCVGYAHYPDVERVSVEFWYLDQGHTGESPYEFTTKQLTAARAKWSENGARLLTATKFPATPSWRCVNCARSTRNGGDCTAWKKR